MSILQQLLRSSLSKRLAEKVGVIAAQKQKSSLLFLVKTSWKEQLKEQLSRARNKPTLREQWKRLNTRANLRGAFKTLSLKYIMEQLWFLKNQYYRTQPTEERRKIHRNLHIAPVTQARASEKSILRRLIMQNKKQV